MTLEELLRKECIIGVIEVLCNVWISGSAVSSFLQSMIFNVKEAKLLEVVAEGEVNIHLVVIECP